MFMCRVNPGWWKSLVIHMGSILVTVLIFNVWMLYYTQIWDMGSYLICIAVFSPVLYLMFGPYMMVMGLCPFTGALFWMMVVVAYVVYFAMFLGSLLSTNRVVRIVLDFALITWFALTLFGIANSEWMAV